MAASSILPQMVDLDTLRLGAVAGTHWLYDLIMIATHLEMVAKALSGMAQQRRAGGLAVGHAPRIREGNKKWQRQR